MNEKLKELLKALGISEANITAFSDEEKAKELKPKEIASEVVGKQKEAALELLKNDGEYRGQVESEIKGKLFHTFRNDIKKRFPEIGLTNKELQEKEPHELLDVAKEKAGKADTEAGKKVEELQQVNVDLTNELSKLKDETIPGLESKAEKEISLERSKMLIKSNLATLKGNKELVPEIDGAFVALDATLQAKYDYKINEKGELDVFLKGTDMKQRPQGKVGDVEKVLTGPEVIRQELTTFGFLQKSNGGLGGGSGGKIEIEKIDKSKLGRSEKKAVTAAEKRLHEMGANE
jgi:hypothetical protein